MSLFGALMGDFDDDLGIMGSHMNAMNMQMRSMNRLMNSLMPDPFNMLAPFDPGFQQNALMERGHPAGMGALFPAFPAMPNMNRLLNADLGGANGSYCSSSVITMSSGPDGRPQYYQASSSQKIGPGGVRETRNSEQDSRTGVKKMAIGHHIGERAHIIEKEQDMRSGQMEERQEFINLEEEEAEQFDREFTSRVTRGGGGMQPRSIRSGHHPQYPQITNGPSTVTIEPVDDSDEEGGDERLRAHPRYLPALPQSSAAPSAPPQQHPHNSAANENATTTTTTATAPRNVTTSHNDNSNAAAVTAATVKQNNNDSSHYAQNSTPRRAHLYRSHLASARRPLRTPSSSPLATTSTPTTSSITTAPSAASHHHHPYNNAAAVRRQQRKQSQKQQQQQLQQQQQQQEFHLQGVQVPTEATSSRHSKSNNRRH